MEIHGRVKRTIEMHVYLCWNMERSGDEAGGLRGDRLSSSCPWPITPDGDTGLV